MQVCSLDSRYRLTDSMLCTELDGELVILQYASESYFSLNRVGTKIWYLLERGVPVRELVEHLVQSYRLSRDQALRDLTLFLESLECNALIESLKE